jgi:hypothetical protein
MASYQLAGLKTWLVTALKSAKGDERRAHLANALAMIGRLEREPLQLVQPAEPLEPPPGQPIGAPEFGEDEW